MFRQLQHIKLVSSLSIKFKFKSISAIKFRPVISGEGEISLLHQSIDVSKNCLNFDQIPHPPVFVTSTSSSILNYCCLGHRVALYSENADPVLNSINECTSMQQVFDIFTSLSENSTLNEKHSCQSLVTLWDIQKFMFKLGHLFHPSALYMNREHYIDILREHPVLLSIIQHVVDNCEILADRPLAAALNVLRSFDFSSRHSQCQKIIEELLKRKQSLELSALRRLCVSMRNDFLYDVLILAEMSPVLYSHIETMTTNEEILNVTIAFGSSFRCLNDSVTTKFLERLNEIWLDKSTLSQLEAYTLYKIVRVLNTCLAINENGNGFNSSDEICSLVNNENVDIIGKTKTLSASSLLRNYANLLVPLVHELDIVQMYKFFLHQSKPVKLLEAMSNQVLQLVNTLNTKPTLHQLTCIQPKNLEQKAKIGFYLNDFIDNCTYFDSVTHIILRILYKTNLDPVLYDKYWGKVHQLILTLREENDIKNDKVTVSEEFSSDFKEDYEGDSFADNCVKIANSNLSSGKYKIVSHTSDYLKFIRQKPAYSNRELERVMEEEVLKLIKQAENYQILLNPSEYAKCLSFLAYMKYPGIQFTWNENYIKNFRVEDLLTVEDALHLGSNCSRKYSYPITNELNKEVAKFLTYGTLHPYDYLAIGKLSVEFQKQSNLDPNFIESMKQLARLPWDDSKVAVELMKLVLRTNYYDPLIHERVSKFICELPDDTPVACAEKFACACFVCASEKLEGIAVSAEIIKSNKDKMHPLALLQSMLSFCYYGCLDLDLVGHVFHVGFLDSVDEEIKCFQDGSPKAMKIRQNFMVLNRAVCIDKPEANVPWFHQKFCEQVSFEFNFRDSYLHQEVGQVLSELLDGQMYVAKNVYSQYFYLMDFLLQFDKLGNPLKPSENGEPRKDAASKVAVLLLHPLDFTTNIRRLKGGHKMKTRHLEKLGYRVIHIDQVAWQSVGTSERLANNYYLYLEALIFSKVKSVALLT